MTYENLIDRFDTLYNNINSGQAPGLLPEEINILLDKAQDEILKNYFNPKGNKYGEGFDQSPKRQIDFSSLIRISEYPLIASELIPNVTVEVFAPSGLEARDGGALAGDIKENASLNVTWSTPSTISEGKNCHSIMIDGKYTYPSSITYTMLTPPIPVVMNDPYHLSGNRVINETKNTILPNLLFIVNEEVILDDNKVLQVRAISNLEYFSYKSAPFKEPLKSQAWRIFGEQYQSTGKTSTYSKTLIDKVSKGNRLHMVEFSIPALTVTYSGQLWKLIVHTGEVPKTYRIRYIKYPKSFSEYSNSDNIELPEELCPEVIQRAIELAKSFFVGDVNSIVELGKRNE